MVTSGKPREQDLPCTREVRVSHRGETRMPRGTHAPGPRRIRVIWHDTLPCAPVAVRAVQPRVAESSHDPRLHRTQRDSDAELCSGSRLRALLGTLIGAFIALYADMAGNILQMQRS